ncbi:MAG TPA: efflux RND transporter periplasmic adaptor subunit [Paracoccaceae bacterium]|nr:efflux RND transporter periplasmic adaptor subunit [Paracoccaceae bacterium]
MRMSALLLLSLGFALPGWAADLTLAPIEVVESKALFGRVESRYVMPARSRIGGTLVTLDVSEGSEVKAGDVIGRIVDPKLESQLSAAQARIDAARSQLQNAEAELKRHDELLARGATTVQRVDQVRTTVEVARNALTEAEAARAVTSQQIAEGDVITPATGRILTVPQRLGAVVMPGEPVATVAGGGVFLRLAIPERHAAELTVGTKVAVEDGTGIVEKVYPQIENGRVIADVAVEGLTDMFIGQRVLVHVPVERRAVLAVPEAAIETRSGIDYVRVATDAGDLPVAVVPGALVESEQGPMREILSGLRSGDRVVTP